MAYRFYNQAEWRVARAQALHDGGHKCARCGTSLIGRGKTAIVHHRKELKRSPALRSEPQNLQPLCTECHNVTHAAMKGGKPVRGCDVDGFPIDPSHPWARSKTGGHG